MNVNPDKIKELVLIFSELDDEYQKELMKQAHVLSLKQSQKKLILKENMKFKNNQEFEEEIEKRSVKTIKETMDMVKLFDEMGDDGKAEMLVLLNKLSGGKFTRSRSIEIKINEKKVHMKDYLDEILPSADYELANKKVTEYLKEIKDKK